MYEVICLDCDRFCGVLGSDEYTYDDCGAYHDNELSASEITPVMSEETKECPLFCCI